MGNSIGLKPATPSTKGGFARLRVAQLITNFSRGGAQATVFNSCLDLPDYVNVSVLAGGDDFGEGSFWADSVDANLDVHEVPHLHRSIRPIADLRCLFWLIKWLRKNEPDVLHTHSSKAGVLGRIAGWATRTPVAHTVHGWSFSPHPTGLVRKLLVTLERSLGYLSESLVVVTTHDRSTGLEERIGRAEKYVVIRSGIDLSEPRKASRSRPAARSELGLGEDEFAVGTVARMADQKKLADLVEGFYRSELWKQKAKLVLIGDGPLRQSLEEQVVKLGIEGCVHFAGVRSNAAFLVAGFDVFALTSAWEGLPRTLIEAMAARVPVIATPVGGVEEVVTSGETGLLVPVSSPTSVASALCQLFSDSEQRNLLAANAEKLVSEFSREEMVRQLVELWTATSRQNHTRYSPAVAEPNSL